MRFVFKVFLALLFVVVILVITPFTPWGNSLIRSYAQSMIDESSPLPLEISQFDLGFSSFFVEVKGKESILATLQGNYSILGLSLDSRLNLEVKDLSYTSEIVGMDLQGAFTLEAKASGDMSFLEIVGQSNIAHSKTIFLAEIKDLQPSNFNLQIEGAEVASLLATIAKPPYAKALLDVKAVIENSPVHGLNGQANVTLHNGEVDTALIKRDFGINAPATYFNTKLSTVFKGDNITHHLMIKSNMGHIVTEGTTNIKTLATDSQYLLNMIDLSPLTPLVQLPIRGDLKLNGEIKGDQKSLLIDGDSNIANSKTTYRAHLVDFALANVEANVQSLNLEKLLYMLHQSIYTRGSLQLNMKLHDFKDGISGQIALEIPNGKINSMPIKQNFNLDMPATTYTLSSASTLHRGKGEFVVLLKSALAQFSIPKAQFSIAPNIALQAPYNITLPDLSKLQFVTGMPLKGKIIADGDVNVNEQGLIVNFLSNMLGGQVVAHLQNTFLEARLDKLRSEEILKMLTYQPFFNSDVNGSLKYELLSKQGVLEASLYQGHLANGPLNALIRPLLGIDLTREVYEQASLKTFIDDTLLTTDFHLASNNTLITAKEAKIDMATNQVDATLTLSVQNKPTNITITGDMKKPKISIDRINQAIEKAKDTVNKKVNEVLDKELQKHMNKEQGDQIKGLLKNLLKP